jgi:hypothetical protein
LGSRVALVWRMAFEDAAGATVESRLISVVVDLAGVGHRCVGRKRLEEMVCDLEPMIRAEIASASAGWQRDADQAVRSFIAARTARRRAIAERIANRPAREFQPGLFERRAERARERVAQDDREAESDATGRLHALRSIGAIALRPAQLLLVLAP